MTNPHPLSPAETIQLKQLEDVLSSAQRWAVEEARALVKIRNGKLYRGKYTTFEEYAERKWGYDRTYLYRLCQWGEVLSALSPIGDVLPARESHARPLYGLAPELQRAAWRLTVKKTSAPTADIVEQAVEKVLRRKKMRITGTAMPTGTVVCADALSERGVATLADNSTDLFLFSPPYTEQRKRYYPSISEKKYTSWILRLMEAIRPKLTPKGSVLIIAREHLRDGQVSDVWLRTRLALRELKWNECDTLVWHKPDAPPLGDRFRPRRTYELIFWFSRTPTPYVNPTACGSQPVSNRAKLNRNRNGVANGPQLFRHFRSAERARVSDVVVAAIGGGIPRGIDHPAMIPIGVPAQLIPTFCPAGGLVADPMCGSGTTLLAARDAGRRWWGCDIVPAYVRTARGRLA